MTYSNENPDLVKRHRLSTGVVSAASAVLAMVAFATGVATIIVAEINAWPVASLLAPAGLWVLGAYYLVLAHDLRQIHDAETSPVRVHVTAEPAEHDVTESLAA